LIPAHLVDKKGKMCLEKCHRGMKLKLLIDGVLLDLMFSFPMRKSVEGFPA
jgi:hypothetical protein